MQPMNEIDLARLVSRHRRAAQRDFRVADREPAYGDPVAYATQAAAADAWSSLVDAIDAVVMRCGYSYQRGQIAGNLCARVAWLRGPKLAMRFARSVFSA